MNRGCSLFCWLLVLGITSVRVAQAAQEGPASRQSLEDAWWTGPLLAASPATLPQGHMLVEPYIFDSIVDGEFDTTGARHSAARQDDYGSLTYLLYGLTDSTTIGLIPRFGFNNPSQGASSSKIGIGDLTVQGNFRLSRYLDCGWLPAMSLVIAESLPTGRYDRLEDRPNDGFGAGTYATTISIFSQYYLWMPNGRILRTRLDVSQSWSSEVNIEGTSVYGTAQGFRGHASPGNSLTVDSAWEYSITRNWVAAIDINYVTSGSTRVSGEYPPLSGGLTTANVQSESGSSRSLSLAPAIEYNWTSTVGIIMGAKWVFAGHNTSASVTPVAAINLVF
jgi:hypothetical protein